MSPYGAPEDPSYYSEQPYAYGEPPVAPQPWYRKPVSLVLLGMLAAVVLALAVYAIVKLASGDSATPTQTSTVTTTVVTGPNGPQTITQTLPPTSRTSAPTTTSQPTTTTPGTSTSASTSTSTVTTTAVTTSTSTVTVTVPETPIGPSGIQPIGPDGIPPNDAGNG